MEYLYFSSPGGVDSGVDEDAFSQTLWKLIAQIPVQRFDIPNESIGEKFIVVLTKEWEGVIEQRLCWSSDFGNDPKGFEAPHQL